MTSKKCSICKKQLLTTSFFFNEKNHNTCISCYKKRTVTSNMCLGCKIKIPTFNYQDESKALYCKICSLPGMIDVIHPKCVTCMQKIPNFNYEGETKALYCKDCSLPDMIDIKHSKCITCKKTRPSFNYKGETKALYCKECSLSNMIDIRSKKCLICKQKYPNFNYQGENKPLYCKECSLPGMIDIKNPKCITCKKKQPVYNYKGQVKALYCKDCSLSGMIDIKHKKCITCKKKRPNFNYEGENEVLYCKGCSLKDMINITGSMCLTCKKIRPSFNYEDENQSLYCKSCSLPGMIDIKSPKCLICKKGAYYGFPMNRPSKCIVHKEEGMIRNPRAKCKKRDCNEYSQYGIKKPIHCKTHKNKLDILLVERKCIRCDRLDIVNENQICINFCLIADEKYEQYKKHIKVKEIRVLNFLKNNFREPTEYNIRISSECGSKTEKGISIEEKEIGYDFGSHKLFIEVDEEQHKKYCEKGEFNRMKNIFFAEGGIPIIFIRYNPDKFNYKNRISNLSQSQRESTLLRWVKYISENKPISPLSVLYLYYDNYNPAQKDPIVIDPYCVSENELEVTQQIKT